MNKGEAFFKGKDGLSIFYRYLIKTKKPVGAVLVAHGIAEHSGRYEEVMNLLADTGLAVYALDHRGHGASEGKRCHVDSFIDYVDDLKTLHDTVRAQHPEGPMFLLGHSMGSVIAIHFTKHYEQLLSGLILSGSGTRPGGDVSPILIFAARFISKIFPKLILRATDLSAYISRNEKVVEDYRNDPLNYLDGFSARLGTELMKYFNLNPETVPAFKLPLLFQAGGDDKLVLGARDLASNFTMKDLTIKIYDGIWHEIYNEPESDKKIVFKDLTHWVKKHLK
jgi:alpha-beta hydrolase superfamily lysophospholipase